MSHTTYKPVWIAAGLIVLVVAAALAVLFIYLGFGADLRF